MIETNSPASGLFSESDSDHFEEITPREQRLAAPVISNCWCRAIINLTSLEDFDRWKTQQEFEWRIFTTSKKKASSGCYEWVNFRCGNHAN